MNVFELTCLVPKIDAKLQSLVSWQENVYVGTDDGHILLYKLAEQKGENNNTTFTYILDKKKHLGHGKKSVDKILIFADLMKLVTLVDGNVDILNAYSLENSISIPQNKGVSLICLEKKSLLYRLCLQFKKKLLFYEFVGSFQLFKEITLPEPAVSLEWYKDTLCIGFKREYILQNIDTNEVTQLFPLDPKQIPVVRLLDEDMLIAKDELGVFITETGQPTRGNILWSSIPIDVVYRSPYIIAIEPKSKLIEIHNFLNQSITQTISFPMGKDFKVASCYEGSKFVLIGSNSEIYCLNEMSLEMQVKNLLEKGKINDAVELVENSCAREPREVAMKKRNRVHADAGLVLYRNLDIDAAYEHFMISDIDPRILIESLPNVAPTEWTFKSTNPIILPSLVENRNDKTTLIKSAMKHLLTFLERKTTFSPFKKEVNTARLKLYLILDDSELAAPKGVLLESLLKSTSDYYNSETESKLQDHKQYHALGLYYKNNQEYKKALDIWQKLGNKTLVDADFDGVSSTVALLSSLDISQSYANLQLIWEYAKWVLNSGPERGIKIFASKLRPIEIPPKQVLEYLAPFGNHLVQLYLEFLIQDCKIQDADFHTRLCLIYIESIKSSITNPIPGIEMLRNKFIWMLENSSVYSENTVLAQIVNLPLYEELLILYTRLRKYSKALEILVVNIADFVRAESYCSKYKEEDPDLMLSLLKVYLSQKVPGKILSDVTVEFLNKHASELSLEHVLAVLPKEVTINMLQGFLSKSLRYHQHALRSQSVVKNILKSEVITLKGELGEMTQRSVVITREKMCPVCGKPLGDRVFAYFPNGTVVHFKCFRDATIDPVTGFDFKKHGEKLFEQ